MKPVFCGLLAFILAGLCPRQDLEYLVRSLWYRTLYNRNAGFARGYHDIFRVMGKKWKKWGRFFFLVIRKKKEPSPFLPECPRKVYS